MEGHFRCVTFMSDFGLADETVACCKGLMLRRGVDLPLIDISHEVPPFDIISGGWMLAGAIPYMPTGVHLAVVDPGVGTERKILIVRSERGDLFVGPDNGLLLPAADRAGGISECWSVERSPGDIGTVSTTFHARDIMAPVVADLVGGMPPGNCGKPVLRGDLTPFPLSAPRIQPGKISGHVTLVDAFGTVRTDIPWSTLGNMGGSDMKVSCGWLFSIPVGRTFADVDSGDLVALEDSWGFVSIAVNRGSASDMLGFKPGDSVSVEFTIPKEQ
jgi:S-adenosyl-L-methionine hydrolase (adenosine-forming)